jgi:hypothetical protein
MQLRGRREICPVGGIGPQTDRRKYGKLTYREKHARSRGQYERLTFREERVNVPAGDSKEN